MDKKSLSIIGFILGGIGLAVEAASSFITDKQTEIMIDEKINEAFNNQNPEEA